MKILFLSPWFPTPPVNGSKIRIYHLLKALSAQHDIHLISFTRPGELVKLPAAEKLYSRVDTIPYQEFQPASWRARLGYLSFAPRSIVDTYRNEMDQIVRTHANWPDVVIASQMVTAPYALGIRSAVRIFEEVELSSGRNAWLSSKGLQRYRRWLTWQKTCLYMRRLLPHFKVVTVVSELERNILGQVAPRVRRVELAPNGVDTQSNRPQWGQPIPGRLVYSGAMTYSANYDAVQYFLADIFPLIREQMPHARLDITGSTQDVDLDQLHLDEYTRLTGFVEDIRPVVAEAWSCVVPLRYGGGTRLKILEAMALGTPVVSTSKGAEGLELTPEENILIADDPKLFAQQVVRLLGDPNLRSRLAENGRHLVEQKYSWAEIGEAFCELVAEVAQA